ALRGGPPEASGGTGSGSGHSDYGRRRGTGTVVIEGADPNSLSGQMEAKMPVTPCAPALSVRRSDRPAHPVGGVFAQVGGRQFHDARLFARRLRRSLRGQRRAELGREKLKKWRILVGFQNHRKSQDAKGTYFPRNLPSRLPEWGSRRSSLRTAQRP